MANPNETAQQKADREAAEKRARENQNPQPNETPEQKRLREEDAARRR